MDKYEFNIKVEQIKKRVKEDDYETAMKIADTIDWRRVRNTSLLDMVAQIYEKNEEYQEAKDILLLAFERAPIGKRLLYRLTELALKEKNVTEAEAYYKEFCDLASDDPRQHLLRYMILKEKGAPAEQLIHSLERYTSIELEEKWLYELAELYQTAGMKQECITMCDKIMLMFGLGKYVDKAMDLKLQFAPLSGYQMDLVENRDKYEAKLRKVAQEYSVGGRDRSEEYDDDDETPLEDPEAMEEDYYASMQEAEVEERLAKELSRISIEDYPEEEDDFAHTRVLTNIKSVNRIPQPAAGYMDDEYGSQNEYHQENYNSKPYGPKEYYSERYDMGEQNPEGYGYEEQNSEGYGEQNPEGYGYEEQNPEGYGYEEQNPQGYAYAEQNPEGNIPEEQDSGLYNSAIYDSDRYDTAEDNSGEYNLDHFNSDDEYRNQQAVTDEQDSLNQQDGHKEQAFLTEEDFYDPEEDFELEDLMEDTEPEEKKTNHLMIEALTPENGLVMAVEALKLIHSEQGTKHQVAKITGQKLNRKGILVAAEKLQGKDLIIEQAGDLSQSVLEELDQLLTQDTSGMIVILIDSPNRIESLHRSHSILATKFDCIGTEEEPEFDMINVEEALSRQTNIQEAAAKEFAVSREPVRPMQTSVNYVPAVPPAEPTAHSEAPAMRPIAASTPAKIQRPAAASTKAPQVAVPEPTLRPASAPAPVLRPVIPPAPSVLLDEPEEEEDIIDDREMDLDEFAQYACRYANEIDCNISGKSMLALYERIEIMEEDGIPLTGNNAELMIEEAADRAEKPSLGKMIKGVFSSRYDKDGLLILKEEHFID